MRMIDYNAVDVLASLDNVAKIRICGDASGYAFSYHAFGKNDVEIGYIIPDLGYSISYIERVWGSANKFNAYTITL